MRRNAFAIAILALLLVLAPLSFAEAETGAVRVSRLVRWNDAEYVPTAAGGVPEGAEVRLSVEDFEGASYYMWYRVDASGAETLVAASESATLAIRSFDATKNGTYVAYVFPVAQEVMNRNNVMDNGRVVLGTLHVLTMEEAPVAPVGVCWGVRAQNGLLLFDASENAVGYRVTLYGADGSALYTAVTAGTCFDFTDQLSRYASSAPLSAGVSAISGVAGVPDSAETVSSAYVSTENAEGTLPVFALEEILDGGSFRMALTGGSLSDAMYRMDVSTASGTGVVWRAYTGWSYDFPADMVFRYTGELVETVMLRFYYAMRGDPSVERYVTVTLNPSVGADVATVALDSAAGITLTQRSGGDLPVNNLYTDARAVVSVQSLYITEEGQYLRQPYAKDMIFDEDGAAVDEAFGGYAVTGIAKPQSYSINPTGDFDVNGEAHFTLTRPGNYTLKVTYAVYEWTDNGWVDTGETFVRAVQVRADDAATPHAGDSASLALWCGLAAGTAVLMLALWAWKKRQLRA